MNIYQFLENEIEDKNLAEYIYNIPWKLLDYKNLGIDGKYYKDENNSVAHTYINGGKDFDGNMVPIESIDLFCNKSIQKDRWIYYPDKNGNIIGRDNKLYIEKRSNVYTFDYHIYMRPFRKNNTLINLYRDYVVGEGEYTDYQYAIPLDDPNYKKKERIIRNKIYDLKEKTAVWFYYTYLKNNIDLNKNPWLDFTIHEFNNKIDSLTFDRDKLLEINEYITKSKSLYK